MITRSSIGNPVELVVDVWSEEFINPDYVSWAISKLHERAGSPDTPFGVYFLDGLDPRAAIGRIVELERFSDSFDNDAAYLKNLYHRYELAGSTELVCVVDHENRAPAGVIRLIRHSRDHGCRTIDDLERTGPDGWGLEPGEIWRRSSLAAREPEDIVDCATLAVAYAYQGLTKAGAVSRALAAAVFNRCLEEDVLSLVCAFEHLPAKLFQAYTGNGFHPFDGVGPQPYYGAENTVPLWSNTRDWEYWIRHHRPRIHERFIGLKGFDNFHFAWPNGPLTWEPTEAEQVVDLTRYVPDSPLRREIAVPS